MRHKAGRPLPEEHWSPLEVAAGMLELMKRRGISPLI